MLVCGDLERSRDFYRDVLGLPLRRDSAHESVEFDLGAGAALLLLEKSELLAVRPGSVQLSFAVQDVDAFVAGCAEHGIPVFEDPYDEPHERVAVIGDPDGYPIQVAAVRRPVHR